VASELNKLAGYAKPRTGWMSGGCTGMNVACMLGYVGRGRCTGNAILACSPDLPHLPRVTPGREVT